MDYHWAQFGSFWKKYFLYKKYSENETISIE